MDAVLLLKHVITEHIIPYEVYHNYLFVDIFVCPSCTRTRGPHLYDVIFLFMTMDQSRQVLCSTLGPLEVRFCVNFP